MTVIKAQTDEEARLAILLHQSRRSEEALAKQIIYMAKRLNRAAIKQIEADREIETILDKLHASEREARRLKALRYRPRAQRNMGIEGVTA
jgi:hypothetical protein